MAQLTRPLRVLHFFKCWEADSFGGVENVITNIAKHTAPHGIQSRVAFLGNRKGVSIAHHEGISGIRFPQDFELASTGFSFSLLWTFHRLAEWADIIHGHFPWPFGDLVHFTNSSNKKLVISYHSDIVKQKWLKRLYSPLMHRFLASADAVVATSPNYVTHSKILRGLKRPPSVIPLGIPDRLLVPADNHCEVYWKNKLGTGFVFFVGALRYYKGLEFLLEAATRVNHPIVIAGSGKLESELKAKAEQQGLSHVHFLGRVSDADKDALHRLSGMFVFPSHLPSEAFGISLLEAAMYGKPLICCEIGTGSTYINQHEKTGLVIPPENPVMLADAINRLLANANERTLFGQAARKRFLTLFTAESMGQRYANLYHQLS